MELLAQQVLEMVVMDILLQFLELQLLMVEEEQEVLEDHQVVEMLVLLLEELAMHH